MSGYKNKKDFIDGYIFVERSAHDGALNYEKLKRDAENAWQRYRKIEGLPDE